MVPQGWCSHTPVLRRRSCNARGRLHPESPVQQTRANVPGLTRSAAPRCDDPYAPSACAPLHRSAQTSRREAMKRLTARSRVRSSLALRIKTGRRDIVSLTASFSVTAAGIKPQNRDRHHAISGFSCQEVVHAFFEKVATVTRGIGNPRRGLFFLRPVPLACPARRQPSRRLVFAGKTRSCGVPAHGAPRCSGET